MNFGGFGWLATTLGSWFTAVVQMWQWTVDLTRGAVDMVQRFVKVGMVTVVFVMTVFAATWTFARRAIQSALQSVVDAATAAASLRETATSAVGSAPTGLIDFVSFLNYALPIEECMGLVLLLFSMAVAGWTYRLCKSWVPTVS